MFANITQITLNKESFNRSDIRTMKKDLARLRENDSLKEREKIIQKTPQILKPILAPIYQEPKTAQVLPQKKEEVTQIKTVMPEKKPPQVVIEKINPPQVSQTVIANQSTLQKDVPKIAEQPLKVISQVDKVNKEVVVKDNFANIDMPKINPPQASPIPSVQQQDKAPQIVKQTINTATQKEQIQRKKFMEDVEKWASMGDKDSKNQ